MMKSENYITIQGWMIKELGLKGNELLCYAIIYGFSQDGKSRFAGSASYLAESLGITKPAVFGILKNLVKKEYILKIEKVANNVKLCDYEINLQVVKKLYRGSKETLSGGSKETLPHISNIDIASVDIYKDKDKENNSFFIAKNKNFLEQYSDGLSKELIKEEWNKIADKYKYIPSVQIVSNAQVDRVRGILKECNLTIKEYFEKIDVAIDNSDYLRGQQWVDEAGGGYYKGADWACHFDYCTWEDNFVNMVNGKGQTPIV